MKWKKEGEGIEKGKRIARWRLLSRGSGSRKGKG
jgi:hypothetical protein